MKSVSALELRKDLKVHTEHVRSSGEPAVLVVHGEEVVGMVPVEWAALLQQVVQFDTCDADPETIKADLKQVFERAFAEVSLQPKFSLIELFKKLAENATTVQQYHAMRKSLKL